MTAEALCRSAESLTEGTWGLFVGTSAQLSAAPLTLQDVGSAGLASERVIIQRTCYPFWGPPAWLRIALSQLNRLIELPPNWDSYGARCIEPRCVEQCLAVLVEVMEEKTPSPQIIPTPEGGLQLEWHRHGVDLEVEIGSNNTAALTSFEDSVEETQWEKSLGQDLSPLLEALRLLTSREMSL